MNKKLSLLTLPLLAITFTACSSDDDPGQGDIKIELQNEYRASTSEILSINPGVENANATYSWVLTKNPVDNVTDSVLSTEKELKFITLYGGTYELTLEVTNGKKKVSQTTAIQVAEETETYNPYITNIYDYEPAPGSYSNECYKTTGATKEDVMKIALGRIDRTNVGYALDLGNFGGSIVVGFDHTVTNVPGKRDFRVYGGELNTSSTGEKVAPGLIYVAYDRNNNGVPDEDEWYEIKGSAHDTKIMNPNFSITYTRPAADKKPIQIGAGDRFYDRESVLCENSDGESYYLTRLKSNGIGDLCPLWLDKDKFTYTGKRFDVSLLNISSPGQYTLFTADIFDWGYVNANDPDIDIDWAIDKNGNKVHLPGIDFIKIFNCVSSGEVMMYSWSQTSMNTKFAGAADLHILEKYNLK